MRRAVGSADFPPFHQPQSTRLSPGSEDTPGKMDWAVDSEQKGSESLWLFREQGTACFPGLRVCWLHCSDSVKDVWFCSQRCYHSSSSCRSWHPPPAPLPSHSLPTPTSASTCLSPPLPLRGAISYLPQRGLSHIDSQNPKGHPN